MATEQGGKDWAGLIAGWKGSGKSIRAYCQEQKVSYWQFARWRRRVEGGTEPKAKAKRLTLVRVKAKEVMSSPVVIRLAGGVVVEVSRGFDAGVLAAVVGALKEPSRC